MKTKSLTVSPFTSAPSKAELSATLIGAAILLAAVFAGHAVNGATLISKAPNAAVSIGLPPTSLEFENPLTGGETVWGHAVLEWRDADYAPGPPRWYDDWTVSDAANIDGNADEIWMRQSKQVAWTATTVPSRIVSVHLNGDVNDGVAQVMVDGVEVARLDMANPVCCQSALVLVRGLSNTSHTITVNDLGAGQGGGTDVHVMGAAALKEHPVKWNQPPATANPTNIFYGWNQTSVTNDPWGTLAGIAADDWVCRTANPVTTIRWWGSFNAWQSNSPPPLMPNAFQITIWTDVPANGGEPGSFSHPGVAQWQTHCINYSANFVGWDYDPRTTNYEACFLFEQTLVPGEYFTQPGGPGTVYWISIAAEYWQGTAGPWPWGWKTRPRDPTSAAPDDAVQIFQPPPWQLAPGMPYVAGQPIFWPDPTNSWDMAFELISDYAGRVTKWEQVPDLSTNGMDVKASTFPPPPHLLADDFLCTSPGYLTNITIWGSWTNDTDWQNLVFTLSIHNDIPTNQSSTGYSMPGSNLWTGTFSNQFSVLPYTNNINEWWFTPTNAWTPNGDHACFQYDFNIPPAQAFWQEGTPEHPKVYWLDVQVQLLGAPPWYAFGWKTCPTNWNDDAVWVNGGEPYDVPPQPPWNRLAYPPTHPREGQTVDMAFRLNAGTKQIYELKWSQPPKVAETVNVFNGWNELSWYGESQIVADDWVCTTTNPVTDIHWWGSFSNWTETTPPEQLPAAFHINFWTDTPAGMGQGPFSTPSNCVWMVICTNYTCQFVGWDWDPRNPDAALEACFRFDCDLSTNEWFHQTQGATGTNIYWISIAAVYGGPTFPTNVWGWKTRPRDTNSLAPDDAVRILNPTAPVPGVDPTYSYYHYGEPIWWPYFSNSWDMAFALTTRGTEELDFGDAPDPSYPTLLTNNGARHYILPGFSLGNTVDAETNGLPDAGATGDDTNNLADEDGVIFSTPLLLGTQACVQVMLTAASGSGQLDAWVDFDRDGNWAVGEKVANNLPLASGTNNLCFLVPTNAALGPTYARFRLSSAGGLLPFGAAGDGEVEDYRVTIAQRRPVTNILITNIVVTNLFATNKVVTIGWQAENDVHYLLQATMTLSNAPSLTWSNVGPGVIGPANSLTETNTLQPERYYRVIAPYVWP